MYDTWSQPGPRIAQIGSGPQDQALSKSAKPDTHSLKQTLQLFWLLFWLRLGLHCQPVLLIHASDFQLRLALEHLWTQLEVASMKRKCLPVVSWRLLRKLEGPAPPPEVREWPPAKEL